MFNSNIGENNVSASTLQQSEKLQKELDVEKSNLNGIEVKTENYAGKMHSKTIIIDDKYSIIGSMNFSNNGEKRNDENMLIIEDKEITQFLKSSFLHLWHKIPNKYLTIDPRPESLESFGSCSDGIDNDFDGKIDSKDKGAF